MIKKTFPIIALATFSTMLGMGILAPVMPLFVNDMGASGIWLGLIGGGYHVSRAILMPFIGRWSDRQGRKIFLGSGLFLYAGISLLYIFAGNLPCLLGVRLLHGLVSGMIIPVARAWIGEISPPGEEGRVPDPLARRLDGLVLAAIHPITDHPVEFPQGLLVLGEFRGLVVVDLLQLPRFPEQAFQGLILEI